MPFQATFGEKGRIYKNAAGEKVFSHGVSNGKITITDKTGKRHQIPLSQFKKSYSRYVPKKKGDALHHMRLGKLRRPFGKKPQPVRPRNKFESSFLTTDLRDSKTKTPFDLGLNFDTKPLAQQQQGIDSSALSLMEEQKQQGLMHELEVRNPFHGKMEKRMFVTDSYTGQLVPYESTDKDHVAAQSGLMQNLEELENFANSGPLEKEIAMHEGSKTGFPFFTEDAATKKQRVTRDAVTSVYNNPDNLVLTDKALNQRVKNDAPTKEFLSTSILHQGMMKKLDYEEGMFTEDGETLGMKLKSNLFSPLNQSHLERNTLLAKQNIGMMNRSTLIRMHQGQSEVESDPKEARRLKRRSRSRSRKHDTLLTAHDRLTEEIDSEDEDSRDLKRMRKKIPSNISATIQGIRSGKPVDIEELQQRVEQQESELQAKDQRIAELEQQLKASQKKVRRLNRKLEKLGGKT